MEGNTLESIQEKVVNVESLRKRNLRESNKNAPSVDFAFKFLV